MPAPANSPPQRAYVVPPARLQPAPLRLWFREHLRRVLDSEGDQLAVVEVEIPEHGPVTMELPAGLLVVPPDLAANKAHSTIGHAMRTAAKDLGIDPKLVRLNSLHGSFDPSMKTRDFGFFAVGPL